MCDKPLLWSSIANRAIEYLKIATAPAQIVREAACVLPKFRSNILLQPETWDLHIGLDKLASDEEASRWHKTFRDLGFPRVDIAPIDCEPLRFGEVPWVLLKQAANPFLATAAQALNYQPSSVNKLIGGPSPLAAALTSGALGAGAGYALGTLGEAFLPPEDFDTGTLRRNATIAGGLIGASPALLWGAASHQGHPETPGFRAWLSGWPFRDKDQAPSLVNKAHKQVPKILKNEGVDRKIVKSAWFDEPEEEPLGQGMDTFARMPMIPKNEFGQAVWNDPNTPVPIRAATMGLVNMASWANNNSPFVSPWDIASVTATGSVRGLLVGKTLGVLAGLKPESQRNLQRIGVWGGMLQAVVPNAFPDPGRLFR